MTTKPIASVLLALPLMVSCNTRYHLAGELDAGPPGGTGGFGVSDASGTGGGVAGGGGKGGGTGAAGSGGGAATNDGGATSDASPVAPVALRISAREALTRVARVLWETVPDQALVAMADSGAVATDQDVRRVALSMLADPRARVGVSHFYRWWLNLDALATTTKDPALFPEYSTTLGTAMAAETEAFALDVTFDGDGRFPTLMRGSYSFVNEPLAKLYGIPGVTGSDLRKVDLDPTQRAGILTQLAFLTQTSSATSWTSPTHRGTFVDQRILCRTPPPPPPSSINQALPDPVPPETNRQRLTRVTSTSVCMACHQFMDNFGFAFEGFDSIGRVRVTDSGLPIDASGSFQLDFEQFMWKDAVEFAQTLAKSRLAQDCMGRNWLTYALGRDLTGDYMGMDATSVAAINDLFVASGLDLRTAIAAAVSSASFLDPTTGGPPCGGSAQSCNDDVRISSLHGMCTPAGKCVCTGTYALNPATGRCL